ncbi:hypothetical protein HHL22_11400 [Hymenobacter sp. RP-2-7]|uniref:Uncharacterized protein n=1 Tax=Hymenobacter polaris TaxID=2682546 RepID=A0A7Y0AEC5_9BACT|nr:hypothetical protein [Hymenobacter polaris]NML65809.1 hypothetical protein [Hymenobacter polaris]
MTLPAQAHRLLLAAPLLLASTLGHAQAPATRDDSLKGRVWTATAQRIWADTKPRAPQPAAWPTNAAFTSWLNQEGKKEKSGIGLLRGDVVRQLGAGHPATAAQVAQAILAEASQPPKSRAWLQRLDLPALQAALQKVTPTAALPAAAADTARRAAPPVLATNDSAMAAPAPATGTLTTTTSGGFFDRHPWLAGLLGVLVGAALVTAARRALRPRSRHHSRRSPETLATPFSMNTTPPDSSEVLRLQDEVQRLTHYIKQLEAKLLHYENANPADAALASTPAAVPEPALAPPVAPAEMPHPSAEAVPAPTTEAAPAADAPPARYGPVPETPYLEDRKLTDDPLPQLALMLLPDPNNPAQASFTLNPHVNQAMLIGDGLTRLEQFFEYEPTLGRATLVEAAEPGLLQRQGDGWQVLERAWLVVS